MDTAQLARVGPKEVVRGKQAVCSSSQPLVTQTMLEVMRTGGSAVDAAIAGSLLQAVIEPHMTNHAGTVEFLYWDAASGQVYQLNGTGTLVPGLPPFRPVPPIGIRFASKEANPCACIPGFVPALGEMHRRFGSKPWRTLCEPNASQGRPSRRTMVLPMMHLMRPPPANHPAISAWRWARMDPLRDDYVLEVESRLPAPVVSGLARRGIQVRPLPMYDYNMGSFQVCWRDPQTGLLNSCADPRRAGQAGGI